MNHGINKFPEGSKGGAPRKQRSLSLEEEIFTSHISQKTSSAPSARKCRRVMAINLYMFPFSL